MTDLSTSNSDNIVSRNVLFNFAGRGGSALTLFISVPMLVALVGAESWGMVGFAASLTAVATVLDLGLGATLSREIARLTAYREKKIYRASLLFSFELPIAALAVVTSLAVYLCAQWISAHWLDSRTLPASTLAYCLRLLAPALGLQMLIALYNGGLLGIQQQLLSNWARLLYTITVYGGAIVLIGLQDSRSITRFFEWQLLCSIVYFLVLRTLLYRVLRTSQRLHWNVQYLLDGLPFAAGIAGTAILVITLTQVDKLLLSRLLSLEAFGGYMLAVTLTSVQILLVQPVHTAIYPQLTQLFDTGDRVAVARVFTRWSAQVGAVVVPLGCLICVFPETVATAWLADAALASKIATPVALLALGSLFNALCTLPYTLQLAAGWASLGFYSNLIAVTVMIPGLLILTPKLGMTGAALLWMLLNAGYLLIQIPFMFTRLLPEYQTLWYREAILAPAIASLMALSVAFGLTAALETGMWTTLISALTAAAAASAFLLRRLRHLQMPSL